MSQNLPGTIVRDEKNDASRFVEGSLIKWPRWAHHFAPQNIWRHLCCWPIQLYNVGLSGLEMVIWTIINLVLVSLNPWSWPYMRWCIYQQHCYATKAVEVRHHECKHMMPQLNLTYIRIWVVLWDFFRGLREIRPRPYLVSYSVADTVLPHPNLFGDHVI